MINIDETKKQEILTVLYEQAVDAHLDDKAKEYGYDSIKTAVTYADEPIVQKFQEEGTAFRAWRSKVYAYVYEQLDLVQSGDRDMPTIDELIAELPDLVI